MNLEMKEQTALTCFGGGIDCAQVVFGAAAAQLGLDEAAARRIAAAFGGGMWRGETCGCVVGALMALGLRYGNAEPGDSETKNAFLAKKQQFEQRFLEENRSLVCRDILEHDLSTPEGMAQIQREKLLETVCPKLVCSACRILEELL